MKHFNWNDTINTINTTKTNYNTPRMGTVHETNNPMLAHNYQCHVGDPDGGGYMLKLNGGKTKTK